MSDGYGYLVEESLLTKEECDSLFKQILYDWQITKSFDYIHESDFRIHCPVQLTDLTKSVIKKVVEKYKPVLKDFFSDVDPWLSELSSICVFPNAKEQHIHRDHSIENGKLVTFFINLLNVEDNAGPLIIKNNPMCLPQGSCVLMDSLTKHAGGSNTSHSNIRPVFYFSIGDPDLDGPTYSIDPKYYKKFKLSFTNKNDTSTNLW